MGDGVVSVDAERHEDVGGGVGDAGLEELDGFAGDISGIPWDSRTPDDIREHVQKSHTEICQKKFFDCLFSAGIEKSINLC